MSDVCRYLACGPEIDLNATRSLQTAVADKLMRQVEEVVVTYAASAPDPTTVLAALQALSDLPRARRCSVLLHPSFRYWLQVMRRTNVKGHDVIRHDFASRFPDFIWPQQFAAGLLTYTWHVQSDDQGGLRCPTFGRYIELGEAYRDQTVDIAPRADYAVIHCRDGLQIQFPLEDLDGPVADPPTIEDYGYTLTISPLAGDGRIEISARDPWLRVKLTGTNQRMDGTEFLGADNELYSVCATGEEVTGALTLLKRYWPDAYEDLTEFTRVIVPLQPAGNVLRPWQNQLPRENYDQPTYLAFTVSSRQGAIYIGPAPLDSSVEMLIHENAHVKLRQLQAIDPLLCDPFDESFKIPVPWRPDPRPLPGILEGLFVFSHVAEFEWRRWQSDPQAMNEDRMIKRIDGLRYSVDCLERHAKLTSGGSEFLAVMKRWVLDLQCRAPQH